MGDTIGTEASHLGESFGSIVNAGSGLGAGVLRGIVLVRLASQVRWSVTCVNKDVNGCQGNAQVN